MTGKACVGWIRLSNSILPIVYTVEEARSRRPESEVAPQGIRGSFYFKVGSDRRLGA